MQSWSSQLSVRTTRLIEVTSVFVGIAATGDVAWVQGGFQ